MRAPSAVVLSPLFQAEASVDINDSKSAEVIGSSGFPCMDRYCDLKRPG